jgi:uncharacterized membrane-anchored protein YhcB (DUF1043 family)
LYLAAADFEPVVLLMYNIVKKVSKVAKQEDKMKLWQVIILTVLLVVVPVLSACGPSKAQQAQEQARREQLEAYQKQMDAYQKSVEAYQKGLEEGLTEYVKEYDKWLEQQQKPARELAGQQ